MSVLDASAAVAIILNSDLARDLFRDALRGEVFHAPHLIDIEVLSALRKLVRLGKIDSRDLPAMIRDFRKLPIDRVAHDPLLERIVALRDNLTAYDAAYVALAELLDIPLVTTDSRLARSSGHRATIELLAR